MIKFLKNRKNLFWGHLGFFLVQIWTKMTFPEKRDLSVFNIQTIYHSAKN